MTGKTLPLDADYNDDIVIRLSRNDWQLLLMYVAGILVGALLFGGASRG